MREKTKQILFYISPIAGQLIFTVVAFLLPWAFARHHALAYLSAILMAPPTILAMIMLVRHQWTSGWVIASLSAQGIFVPVHFAVVHHAIGFQPSAVRSDSFWDALYYSIVTWTTLGYGDIVPVRDLRMFAAVEALYGYVFLGLIVGVLSARFRS